MGKRSSDQDNLAFHLTLLKLIPYRRKVTAKYLHQQLKELGYHKGMRTLQRALQKLVAEYEIDCDDRTLPYAYTRRTQPTPLATLSGAQAAFIQIATEKLTGSVPQNLISAMSPLVAQAKAVLQSGNRNSAERQWLRNVQINHIHSWLDKNIINQLSSLIYQRKQAKITRYFQIIQVSPLGLFDTADSIYLIAKDLNDKILSINLAHIKHVEPLSLSAVLHTEEDLRHYIDVSNASQFDALNGKMLSDIVINKEEKMSDTPMLHPQWLACDEDEARVHIIARGDFGANLLDNMALPQSPNLSIEHLALNEPSTYLTEKLDIVLLLTDEFDWLKMRRTENIEALFIIGSRPTQGLIEPYSCFVYGQSIEEYRTLMLTLLNQLFEPGLIAIDSNDIKSLLRQGGTGIIASSYVEGSAESGRAERATESVLSHLSQQSISLNQVQNCLVNIVAGEDLALDEFVKTSEILAENLGDEVTMVTGISSDMNITGMRVSVLMML